MLESLTKHIGKPVSIIINGGEKYVFGYWDVKIREISKDSILIEEFPNLENDPLKKIPLEILNSVAYNSKIIYSSENHAKL